MRPSAQRCEQEDEGERPSLSDGATWRRRTASPDRGLSAPGVRQTHLSLYLLAPLTHCTLDSFMRRRSSPWKLRDRSSPEASSARRVLSPEPDLSMADTRAPRSPCSMPRQQVRLLPKRRGEPAEQQQSKLERERSSPPQDGLGALTARSAAQRVLVRRIELLLLAVEQRWFERAQTAGRGAGSRVAEPRESEPLG